MPNGNSDTSAEGEAAYVAAIRELIRTLLPHGYPSVTRTAGALDVSVRTLQRRLHTAGVSYSDLVERVRLETARRLLEETNLPLHDIATALGYSQPSSLSRLIARKTGKTPRDHRREHRKRG